MRNKGSFYFNEQNSVAVPLKQTGKCVNTEELCLRGEFCCLKKSLTWKLDPASCKVKCVVLWCVLTLGYMMHLFLGCCTVYKAESASVAKCSVPFHAYETCSERANSEQSFQVSFKIIKCPFEIICKPMEVVTINKSVEYKKKIFHGCMECENDQNEYNLG